MNIGCAAGHVDPGQVIVGVVQVQGAGTLFGDDAVLGTIRMHQTGDIQRGRLGHIESQLRSCVIIATQTDLGLDGVIAGGGVDDILGQFVVIQGSVC